MPTDKRQRQRENSRARQEAIRAAQKQSARRRQIFRTVLAIAAIVGVLFLGGLIGGGDDEPVASKDATTTTTVAVPSVKPGTTPCPPDEGTPERKVEFDGPPKNCLEKDKTYTATVETDAGTFKVELDSKNAPKTVNNFVFLARHHFYDGVVYHRVIPGFMIQGGDPEGTGSGGPGYKFNDEIPEGHKYEVGQIVMANSGPNTQGSQFFVVTGPQGEGLPPSYSPFGKVVDGLDVVKKIEADGNADPQSNGVPPKVLHKMLKVTITES
ncbi:MAG TPA: peptidylprolyl isomerase [Acidimicrobiales bacterium]|nr:peptidylprolyl isomerase [Acidimicrobiales bacterium]